LCVPMETREDLVIWKYGRPMAEWRLGHIMGLENKGLVHWNG
jgi:hypothetical protein